MSTAYGYEEATAIIFDEVWLRPRAGGAAQPSALARDFYEETGVRLAYAIMDDITVAVSAVPRRIRAAIKDGDAQLQAPSQWHVEGSSMCLPHVIASMRAIGDDIAAITSVRSEGPYRYDFPFIHQCGLV